MTSLQQQFQQQDQGFGSKLPVSGANFGSAQSAKGSTPKAGVQPRFNAAKQPHKISMENRHSSNPIAKANVQGKNPREVSNFQSSASNLFDLLSEPLPAAPKRSANELELSGLIQNLGSKRPRTGSSSNMQLSSLMNNNPMTSSAQNLHPTRMMVPNLAPPQLCSQCKTPLNTESQSGSEPRDGLCGTCSLWQVFDKQDNSGMQGGRRPDNFNEGSQPANNADVTTGEYDSQRLQDDILFSQNLDSDFDFQY